MEHKRPPSSRPSTPALDYAGPMADQPREQRRRRRPATPREAKALAHSLRIRILRECLVRDLTNKELADLLQVNPGTVLHHVRVLVDVGFLVPGDPRNGAGGALEKPYRATGETWWLEDPLADTEEGTAPVLRAFHDEVGEVPAETVDTFFRFALHLSEEEATEFGARILAVIDEYVATDDQRRDRPLRGGMFLLHHYPDRPHT